jgi:hypothetical protein
VHPHEHVSIGSAVKVTALNEEDGCGRNSQRAPWLRIDVPGEAA